MVSVGELLRLFFLDVVDEDFEFQDSWFFGWNVFIGICVNQGLFFFDVVGVIVYIFQVDWGLVFFLFCFVLLWWKVICLIFLI